jgi:hypothetical protein
MPAASRRRRIDHGRQRGLHTSGQHEHAPRVARLGPGATGSGARRHGLLERRWQQRADRLTEPEQGGEQRRSRQHGAERGTRKAPEESALCALLDEAAPDVDQSAIAHARGAGRLA